MSPCRDAMPWLEVGMGLLALEGWFSLVRCLFVVGFFGSFGCGWFWLFVGLQPSLVVVGVLFFFFLLWVGSMFPMETLVWF